MSNGSGFKQMLQNGLQTSRREYIPNAKDKRLPRRPDSTTNHIRAEGIGTRNSL